MLIVATALGSVSVIAQQENESKRIPDGKWVLESVAAFEENVQIPFSADNIDFDIPAEISIQQDDVTFVYKETTEKVKYSIAVRANYLCFLVCAEWKIADGKLQLQWTQDLDNSLGGADTRVITLGYSYK